MDAYWEAIRQKVCAKCIDGDRKGNCLLGGDRECSLITYFPEMVEIILSVKSNYLEDYVSALRSGVCSQCKYSTPDGRCRFRESVDCGLDRYFPLIVEAVESVRTAKQAEIGVR
jgi:RNA polymerase subunit RPABC4/transcription elongation factor Spt4